MEFNKKLQELRKQKSLTQEALAEKLYVSRTAVSKWESGRGYPSIDSLKAIAQFFAVTIDELISTDEMLNVAEDGQRRTAKHYRDLVLGLLDICISLLIFLPLFASREGEIVTPVSLIYLGGVSLFPKILYFIAVIAASLTGIATLALQGCGGRIWLKVKTPLSLSLGALAVMLFTLGLHPYAAAFAFSLLAVKALVLTRHKD